MSERLLNLRVALSPGELRCRPGPMAKQIELVKGGGGENTENVPLVTNLEVERERARTENCVLLLKM